MRFGVCCEEQNFAFVKNAGYDYIEYSFSKLVKISDEEFFHLQKSLREVNMEAESFNGFFPGSEILLVGENVDFEKIRAFAEAGFKRAAAIGGKIAIIGSGSARMVPDGFSKEKAVEQFSEVLKICASEAEKVGMKIVVEPLSYGDTNFINTVAEGKELVKTINNKSIGCLVDFYHFGVNGEDISTVSEPDGLLYHVHVARGDKSRAIPNPDTDLEAVQEWAAALKNAGYNGRISLEGHFLPDFETAITEFIKMKNLFN